MSLLKGLAARARSLFGGRASEARMEEEFHFHLAMDTDRRVAQGLPALEAKRQALVAFGGVDRHREAMRDGRGGRMLTDFRGDVRYALRAMRRSPGFAIAVAITLGIGIGVNGVVFGFINSMLFRAIPALNPQALVGVFTVDTKTGMPGLLAYEDYLDFRDRSNAFAGLAGSTGVPLNLVSANGANAADMVWGEIVTENYFSVLGMRPRAGRFFSDVDAVPGADPYAVLTYESWKSRFHLDSAVIGRTVKINGGEFTILGVAPPGFKGMRSFGFWPEIFVPAGMHDIVMPGSRNLLHGRGDGWMYVVGRMHPGWTQSRTERAARLFAGQLASSYPATNVSTGIMLVPGAAGFDHPAFVKPRILVLSSAVGLFGSLVTLLIICANLANMQLARAAARSREIAIRLSLGCSRARLARQLLTEALVLAVPGAVLAAIIVRFGPLLESYAVPHLQFRVGIGATTDPLVAVFTGAVALLAVALFGLAPALRATRPAVRPSAANVIGARSSRARPGQRAGGLLVVAQLAMSVVLLVGGTLFVRSMILARGMDLGFDPSRRLLLSVNVGLQNYDEAKGRAFYDAVLERVRSLPDVASASWAFPAPFDTYGRGAVLYTESARTNTKQGTVVANASFVSDGFTRTLGFHIQEGRDVSLADSSGAPPVILVSRSLASRLWPGRDAVGQRARLGGASGRELLVIGVIGDATFSSLGERTTEHAYMPLRQRYLDWETLVVHTRGDPLLVLPRVRAIIAAADPTLPTFGAMTMQQSVESGFATSRMAATVAGFFAMLALLIAAVGLYAVVAGNVAERTREIGLRLALGSTPAGVLRFIMSGGARLGVWGLVIGIACALGVAKMLGGLLYGLSPTDPVTFVLAPIALAIVVLLATYLPARRAVRLDPIVALRSD